MRLPEPVELVHDGDAPFSAHAQFCDLGSVTICRFRTYGPLDLTLRRPWELVRSGDPQVVRMLISMGGRTGLTQFDRQEILHPGQAAYYLSSAPHEGWRRAAGRFSDLLMLSIEVDTLGDLPIATLRDNAACRLPVSVEMTGLLNCLGRRILCGGDHYTRADIEIVTAMLVSAVTGVLTPEADDDIPTGHRFKRSICEYIEENLGDPNLTPTSIAAAHHLSVRTVHRLFEGQDATLGAWIRALRLERCRKDLLSVDLADRPVHAIAARWGFPDPAHFSRCFTAAFGLTPGAYRRTGGGRA
ncbi:helix-turn-helix domain-containing protein [Microbispora sp. H10670]|uniref:helix-turn-helix domain-containing protein n=1 Tax=Microbispora sp. H10670 TaxID=2729108 RepID=UPI0015FF5BC1|nr:helix-turn-helix domain-containing protein [Microbispora sp. H10670]